MGSKLIQVQLEKMESQEKQRALENLIRSGNISSDIPDIIDSGNLDNIRTSLVDVESAISNAKASLGIKHPKYIALEQQRAALEKRLARESKTTVDALQMKVQRLAMQEKELSQSMNDYKNKTLENKKDRDVVSSYQRQLESVQRVYNAAIQKYDEILMTSRVSISNTVVMRWAEVPDKYDKPVLKINLLFGVVTGLILGLSLAFLLELANRRVRCVDDLKREFLVPVLGQIGFVQKQEEISAINRFFSGSTHSKIRGPNDSI